MIDKIKTLQKKLLGDGSSSKRQQKNQLDIIGFSVKSTSQMVQLNCEIN